jgi:hypothetical protein
MADARQKLLFAMYVVYQQDYPDFTVITKELLGIESASVFFATLRKLEIEGMLTTLPIQSDVGLFTELAVNMAFISLTKKGLHSFEKAYDIKRFISGASKIKALEGAKHGSRELSDLINRVSALFN